MKHILPLFLLLISHLGVNAQEQDVRTGKPPVIYTVIYNSIPGHQKYPLIGFFNQSHGPHSSLELGFVNSCLGAFTGAQLGFFNRNLQLNGAGIGFCNLSLGSVKGMQGGFFNSSGKQVNGMQLGFVNIAPQHVQGAQAGFVNLAGEDINGMQLGFVNIADDSARGLQAGFLNLGGEQVRGMQLGFVNLGGQLRRGLQIGFVNVVDSIEKGIPIGFISIVGKGGYQALEAGANEYFPVQFSYKLGVRKFYTTFIAAYHSGDNYVATGIGFGSNIDLKHSLYLNLEATSVNQVNDWDNTQINRLAVQLGYGQRLSVLAGPNVSVLVRDDEDHPYSEPMFSFYKDDLSRNVRLLVGAQVNLRWEL